MQIQERINHFGRQLFGITKRPIWLAIHALTGKRTQATARYLDFGMYGGHFEADAPSLAGRLPPGFQAVETHAGITEVEIWCAEYRRMDILRPYNEMAVIVPVRFVQDGQPPIVGGYVLHMLVTTEEARWAGVDNYGFPKILAAIDISDEPGNRKRCTVWHRGVQVLELSVDSRQVERFDMPATLLNVRDDSRVIECQFSMNGERCVSDRPGGVSLELGRHAIADELRQIGVRAKSGCVLYMPVANGVLGKGIDLGALPERAPAPVVRSTAPGIGQRPLPGSMTH